MKGAPFPDEMSFLWFVVRRVAGLIDRAGEALFRRELNISLAQFLVLSVVDAHPGPLNQQAIADRLGLTKGTVSRQLENSVAAGLMTVQASALNRRENTVALTASGTDLVRRGDAVFHEVRQSAMPAIAADDMATTLRVLTAMNHTLDSSLRQNK